MPPEVSSGPLARHALPLHFMGWNSSDKEGMNQKQKGENRPRLWLREIGPVLVLPGSSLKRMVVSDLNRHRRHHHPDCG